MEQIKVFKDYDVNQVYPSMVLMEDGENIELMFTPLFREEEGETVLLEGAFEMGEDTKTVVLLWNKGEWIAGGAYDYCRIKAGNGIQGVEDMRMGIAKGGVVTVTPESGRFKQITGTYKGKVILSPEGGKFYVAVFEAP